MYERMWISAVHGREAERCSCHTKFKQGLETGHRDVDGWLGELCLSGVQEGRQEVPTIQQKVVLQGFKHLQEHHSTMLSQLDEDALWLHPVIGPSRHFTTKFRGRRSAVT